MINTAGYKICDIEKENGELALEIAAEGIVLLENSGALPLKSKNVALYGSGARNTCKGGTGSGEVNNRRNINVEEGLELCGFRVTTKGWLDDCDSQMAREEEARDAKIRQIGKKYSVFRFWELMNELALPIIYPKGRDITQSDVAASDTDTAVYVLTRQAGEGGDRRNVKGEYYPTDKELRDLQFLVAHYKNTILVINAGACIDMAQLLAAKPGAVIFMGQAGQAGGLALAQLMSGSRNFSGRLAATWPKDLADLPCSDSYSFLDGNTEKEIYKDGIYVGYRYYDTFGAEPMYAFGYGLSYTRFNISAEAELNGSRISVCAKVKNIGSVAGKEIVQVYISCPGGKIAREYQQLAAFAKTRRLDAGGSEEVNLGFDISDFAAYDEENSCFVLEKGSYLIRVGNSSRNTECIASVVLSKDVITERCRATGGARGRVREIQAPAGCRGAECAGKVLYLDEKAVAVIKHDYSAPYVKILPEAARMTDKELSDICVGDPALMSGGIPDVVGACGQIDKKVCKKYGYFPAVMADGPAGIRIAREYAVEPGGKIKTKGKLPQELIKAKKLFAWLDRIWGRHSKRAKQVYQFCTAWPVAAVQAQTFSPALIKEAGRAISAEMVRYGVGIWLAPGINIQRHPLCGRNFEYYSEDPVLTAAMACAVVSGVQEDSRCAVTVKHFCCNNQEDNRMKSSSEINERAMREIYLKAFKLVVKNARPECIMSSYNKVNGTYVNSSSDLINGVLRCEFGFEGVVMTDWQSVAVGQADAGEVLSAENDLIMAGNKYQHKALLGAVKSGRTDRLHLQRCASRILLLCKKLHP